jgi:hypothetical protein
MARNEFELVGKKKLRNLGRIEQALVACAARNDLLPYSYTYIERPKKQNE